MLRLIRRQRKNGEKGQALVEFSLLVPIFAILLFAIVDFGMGFYSWITVTNAAREGARLGAVLASEYEIEQRVKDSVNLPDEDDRMTVTVGCGPSGSATEACPSLPGESVVVQVDYDYDLITPLARLVQLVSGSTLGPTLTFSSTAEMRLE